jgi:hypothetical protein
VEPILGQIAVCDRRSIGRQIFDDSILLKIPKGELEAGA